MNTDHRPLATGHSLLPRAFFQREPLIVAVDLLGTVLTWQGCRGRIVETEAYQTDGDEACHTFFRPSTRRFVAEHPPGTAYVYLNYGVHWLFNVLCKTPDEAIEGFVLIRALEPLAGLDDMRHRRRKDRLRDLCSGPGKLTNALGITGDDHGHDLLSDPRRTLDSADGNSPETQPEHRDPVADVRIGISRSADLPWRFLYPNSPHISVKPTRAARPLNKKKLRGKR